MNDFKIMDTFEEVDSTKKKSQLPDNVKLVLIIVVSLLVGVGVFVASNTIFGKKDDDQLPITTTTLSTNDKTVLELYEMVNYGDRGVRTEKFMKEEKVDLNSFNNSEKFYYAMQFATMADFSNSGNVDASGKKIYTISNDKVNQYMTRFFGPKVTYSTDGANTITFDFTIENSNVGTMIYDLNRDAFATTFSGVNNDYVNNSNIKPFYSKIAAAASRSDGTLEIKERIIYTTLVQNKDVNGNLIDNYSLSIFRDYNKTMLIETRNNLSANTVSQYALSLDDYASQSSVITYKFKKQSSGYYFVGSMVES